MKYIQTTFTIKNKILPQWVLWLFIVFCLFLIGYIDSLEVMLAPKILNFVQTHKLDWNMWAAIGTILSAVVALGISVFSYLQSIARDKKSREKEAIEKILTPIRKELDSLSNSKWHAWYPGNRWHTLKELKLDFPLQYFWLNKKIKNLLESFDTQWASFEHLSHQERENFNKLISDVFRIFLKNNNISSEITGEKGISDEAINNIHWSCVVGGKSGAAVTIHSLVLWNSSLSKYLDERKKDEEIPNTKITDVIFSITSSSATIRLNPNPDLKQSDLLLSGIQAEIQKNKGVKEYRDKWQGLYNNGSLLLKEIDLWLSEQ